mmetsp:Transcript_93015/g.170661  ORF Transcript_93015/g.170661 Transcript_93015/m.170661 type:complete len:306 (+) Transcript_93015:1035-1952(+)
MVCIRILHLLHGLYASGIGARGCPDFIDCGRAFAMPCQDKLLVISPERSCQLRPRLFQILQLIFQRSGARRSFSSCPLNPILTLHILLFPRVQEKPFVDLSRTRTTLRQQLPIACLRLLREHVHWGREQYRRERWEFPAQLHHQFTTTLQHTVTNRNERRIHNDRGSRHASEEKIRRCCHGNFITTQHGHRDLERDRDVCCLLCTHRSSWCLILRHHPPPICRTLLNFFNLSRRLILHGSKFGSRLRLGGVAPRRHESGDFRGDGLLGSFFRGTSERLVCFPGALAFQPATLPIVMLLELLDVWS